MTIRPSTAIRQNYNEISNLCKETGEPVYLTENGEEDLVVMDIGAFVKREKMLSLREKLLSVEENRHSGAMGYFVDEVNDILTAVIEEV
ncbi:MAG: type II toxin-antitoxin system Phd/YefM family antitoxin [Clostridiales bacterium]|nr:type II toxin-antitoxin system Phd/YefM family antitoxin [Clostridiales bacterium]